MERPPYEIALMHDHILRLEEELQAKEQECKELKKTSCKFKNYCTCDTEKLKQTLTEIKEIAEKHCVCGVDCIDMKQILQKISEVEDE